MRLHDLSLGNQRRCCCEPRRECSLDWVVIARGWKIMWSSQWMWSRPVICTHECPEGCLHQLCVHASLRVSPGAGLTSLAKPFQVHAAMCVQVLTGTGQHQDAFLDLQRLKAVAPDTPGLLSMLRAAAAACLDNRPSTDARVMSDAGSCFDSNCLFTFGARECHDAH